MCNLDRIYVDFEKRQWTAIISLWAILCNEIGKIFSKSHPEERMGKLSIDPRFVYRHLQVDSKSDVTTYEGGGGDGSRRCDFKAVGLLFAIRAAVPVLEVN